MILGRRVIWLHNGAERLSCALVLAQSTPGVGQVSAGISNELGIDANWRCSAAGIGKPTGNEFGYWSALIHRAYVVKLRRLILIRPETASEMLAIHVAAIA